MRRNLWERFEERIKPKLSKQQEQYWEVLIFLMRLLLLSIPLYIILSVPGLLYSLQLWTANFTTLLLQTLGFPATQDGVWITINYADNPFTFIISEDCTGWKSIMFLFALLFAIKKAVLKSRLAGLLAGAVTLLVANMLRILAVVYAERLWGQDFAMILHDWLFRYGLVLLVLGLWVFWMVYLNKKFKKKT